MFKLFKTKQEKANSLLEKIEIIEFNLKSLEEKLKETSVFNIIVYEKIGKMLKRYEEKKAKYQKQLKKFKNIDSLPKEAKIYDLKKNIIGYTTYKNEI